MRRRSGAKREKPPSSSRSGRYFPPRFRRPPVVTGAARTPWTEPVPAFVVGPRRHHPYAANGLATALQQRRRASARSYLQDTPPLPNSKHLDDQSQAPGATPASTAVPRFVNGLRPSVRVGSSCYAAGRSRMPEPPGPGIISTGASARDFPLRMQKLGVPIGYNSSQFGNASRQTHWQGLSPLSWLSFSPPGICPGRRSRSQNRFSPVAGGKLPTPAALNEQGQLRPTARTPPAGLVPVGTHPLRTITAASPFVTRMRFSPVARPRGQSNWIEPRDYSAQPCLSPTTRAAAGRDYSGEPPSIWTSHSRGIQLYRRDVAVGMSAPLADW